jgi:hypothetical protein
MMSTATAVPAGTTFSGTRLLDSGRALSQAVQNGNWLDGGIAFLDTLGNAAAAVTDPIGTIVSFGLGWVMEHLKPLSTWLEQLAGSEANVNAVAAQWTSAGSTMVQTGATLTGKLSDLEGLSGGTVAAYVRFAKDAAQHLSASGEWAQAAATGLAGASTLVARMQSVVKDAISKVMAVAIEAMAVVAASLGLGMGYAIARVVMKVNQMVNKVVKPIAQVLKSVKALTGLVGQIRTLFEGTADKAMSELQGQTTNLTIGVGNVVDASAATQFGNTAYDRLVLSGQKADAVSHDLTPVTAIPVGADASLTVDADMAGVTSLGGSGGSVALGSGSTVTVSGSSAGGGSSSISGSSISGGNGAAATGVATAGAGAAAMMGRPMTPVMNPISATSGGTRGGLGMRRRDLRVQIERDDEDD